MRAFGAVLQYQEEAMSIYTQQEQQQELFKTKHQEPEHQAQKMVDQEHAELETWYATLSDGQQKKVDQRITQKIKQMKISKEDELFSALTAQARYQVLAELKPRMQPGG